MKTYNSKITLYDIFYFQAAFYVNLTYMFCLFSHKKLEFSWNSDLLKFLFFDVDLDPDDGRPPGFGSVYGGYNADPVFRSILYNQA